LIEIRFHGRGGQGAVTSAELLAVAAISEGKYAQAFPSFGPERRGAPVVAYARVDDRPIRLRTNIYHPDVVVILDPGLLEVANVLEGLKEGGTVVINTNKSAEELGIKGNFKVAAVDADRIAREVLGRPITNTTMLGALLKAVEIVSPSSLIEPLNKRFGRIASKNIEAFQKAYEETRLIH